MSTSPGIGSTTSRDKPAALASTGQEPWPLIHMINLDEVDLSLVVVQTHRKALGTRKVETCGERMSLDEASRRNQLKRRPVTASDVPQEHWTEHLEQYFLREDGALVTSNHAVAWGYLDGAGGICWEIMPRAE